MSQRENYTYRTADGKKVFRITRFGGTGKAKKFGAYTLDDEGKAIDPRMPAEYSAPNSRPLLDLPDILDKDFILLVEGERTAKFAASYLPNQDWGVTTWSGGAQAVNQTDWLPLEGKTVVCWPDNDDAGRVAMLTINDKYLSYMQIPCTVITELSKFTHKWDLADDLPEDVEPQDITDIIAEAAKAAKVFENPTKQADSLPFDDNVHYLPKTYKSAQSDIQSFALNSLKEDKFRVLGYSGEKLFFLATANQSVCETTIEKLSKITGLMAINPDRFYWDDMVWTALSNGAKGKPDYVIIAGEMAKQCYDAGIFTYDGKMRGRGFWYDGGNLVLHLGNKILTDGHLFNPSKFVKGKYVYEVKEKLIAYEDEFPALTDEEGHKIVLACTKANWRNPVFASLYAGWMVTALMGGSLEWRPHIWITGNKGSGKTWVYKHICKKVMGSFAVYLAGDCTEPGIRNEVRNDSRPVCFDEAEATDRRSLENIKRILGLLRVSSSDDIGKMVKGSSGGGGSISYELRCSFYMTSIGDALSLGQDKQRVTVLSLKSSTEIEDPVVRGEKQSDFINCSAELDKIPNLTARLIKRILANHKVFDESLKVFKREAAHYFNNGRHGEQLGTLLAGRWILTQSMPVTPEVAKKVLSQYDWREMMDDVTDEREDMDVLSMIMGASIKCELTGGGMAERKVSELVSLCIGQIPDYDIKVSDATAHATLARFGIKIAGFNRSVQIAITSRGMVNELMCGTQYESSWAKIIRRHPKIVGGVTKSRFAGQDCRYVEVPIAEMCPAE